MNYMRALLLLPLVFAGGPLWSATAITPQSIDYVLESGLQAQINISQFVDTGSDIKVLHASGGSPITSAVQSFTWTSAEQMTGLGVLVGGLTDWNSQQQQNFELRIYSATALGGSVGTEIATFTFTMTSSLAVANKWLYFNFPTPLTLADSGVYFFQLASVSSGGAVLALQSSFGGGTDLYAGGRSGQVSSNAVTLPSNQVWDYTFFTTSAPSSVPEPSSYAMLFGILACAAVVCSRKAFRRRQA